MLKFVYLILLSCLLGFFTFQLSQEKLYTTSADPSVEINLSDSLAAEKLPILKVNDSQNAKLLDLEESEETYYESSDASIGMLYAIFQFVWKLYE